MNIFVGNLSFDAVEEDVKKLFEGFGSVVSVVIVKEKNGIKSRGFGFVEMADQKQGEAAIAALNSKEFMGRPLNVSPEKPRSELDEISKKKKKLPEKIKVAPQEYHGQKDFGKDKWFSPVFRSAGGEKKRRARRGYGQRDEKEINEPPMTLRKREERPRPWRKNADESKPAKRFGEHRKIWRKPEGGAKPWRKPEGESRPWRKPEAGARSWRKPEGEARPWRKPSGEAKPWRKPRETTGSGWKSRKKPGAYKK
jgi:RNA recognition motif-containing protein